MQIAQTFLNVGQNTLQASKCKVPATHPAAPASRLRRRVRAAAHHSRTGSPQPPAAPPPSAHAATAPTCKTGKTDTRNEDGEDKGWWSGCIMGNRESVKQHCGVWGT